jgi:hypothetical protein
MTTVDDRLILSSGRAPHISKPATVWQLHNSGLGLQIGLDTKTGRMIVVRNVTLALTSNVHPSPRFAHGFQPSICI